MPKVTIPIMGADETVVRKSVHDMIDDILMHSTIKNNTKVIITNDTEVEQQDFNVLSNKNEKGVSIDTSYLRVRISSTPNEYSVSKLSSDRNTTRPFWKDSVANVTMSPVREGVELSLIMTFTTSSNQRAQTWHKELIRYIKRSRRVHMHNLEYSYVLPSAVFTLIRTVHERRGYSGDIFKYIEDHNVGTMGVANTINGDGAELKVREKQSRVQGYFDISSDLPKPEYDKELGKWTVETVYKTQMDVPARIMLDYPIIVCNKMMPNSYVVPLSAYPGYNPSRAYLDEDMYGISNMESDPLYDAVTGKSHVVIPDFDNWIRPPIPDNYVTIFTALHTIDPNNLQVLGNLRTLGPVTILDPLLDYWVSGAHTTLTKPFIDIFHLTLYKDDERVRTDHLTVNSDLDIIMTLPPAMCSVYRVCLEVNVSLPSLRNDVVAELLTNSELLDLYLTCLNLPEVSKYITSPLHKKNVKGLDLVGKFRYYLDNASTIDTSNVNSGMRTVMVHSVLATSN